MLEAASEHGYVILDVGYDRVSAEHWSMASKSTEDHGHYVGAVLDVDRFRGLGQPHSHMHPSLRIAGIALDRAGVPRPAPLD